MKQCWYKGGLLVTFSRLLWYVTLSCRNCTGPILIFGTWQRRRQECGDVSVQEKKNLVFSLILSVLTGAGVRIGPLQCLSVERAGLLRQQRGVTWQLIGTSSLHSQQQVFHMTLIQHLIYTSKHTRVAIWPILCRWNLKPTKTDNFKWRSCELHAKIQVSTGSDIKKHHCENKSGDCCITEMMIK